MSNYVKSTNFTAKDSLPTGDTNKVIRGSEFDTEFNAIATAVSTKSDLAGPTFTGTATFDGITATGTVDFSGGNVTTNIDGGTIDGVTIGGSTPGAGTFSSLTATTADINAGTVDNTVIGGTTPAAGTFSSLTATTADINGGSIDGAVIGGSTPAAISGTTGTFSGAVSGTTGTFSGAVTGSNLNVSNWDTAFGWGDHSTEGYLTSVSFSDIDAAAVTLSTETFTDSDTQIPTNAAVIDYVAATIPLITEVNDLSTVVTWANVPDANITESSVTQHEAALSISTSQLAGGLSLSDITDVTATATEVNYTDGVTSNIQTQLDSKVGANYTGDVDITGELLVDSYNETFKKVSSVSAVTGFLLSSASYDSKSLSVSSQETSPSGIRFNNDGTKLYLIGYTGDDINQYSLSTPYDVSTGTFDSVTFSVSSQSSIPMGFTWNNDGTKFFVVEYTGTVYQYSCSTAYDISTASYDSLSSDITSQTTQASGLVFNNDGTKLFIIDQSADTIYQYSLSTAFVINTLSYDSVSFSVASQETTPRGFIFNNDGTNFYVVGSGNDTVYEYALTSAFDLSTASYNSVSFSVTTQDTSPEDIIFNANGDKMYILGSSNDAVYQYTTGTTTYSTTFDCENANVFETELDANTTVVFSNPPASGTPVVTNYDLSNASYDSVSLDVSSQNTTPVAVEFSSDGTAMYMVGNTDPDTVFQYTLSTAWDLSTASYASKSFSTSTQETNVGGLSFKSDGTKMYIVGTGNDTVYQYSLSTAWDVSTMSHNQNFSVTSQEANPTGVCFKDDGTTMYVIGATSDQIHEYDLSTAWDVSTASFSQELSVNAQESAPTGLVFKTDGTKMYVCGSNDDDVNEYDLSTAWDISTASFSQNFREPSPPEGNLRDVFFKPDGTRFWITGRTFDTVYQYNIQSS